MDNGEMCSKTEVLLFRYGEASRSGDSCHEKDSLLLTVPKGHAMAGEGPGESAGSVGRQRSKARVRSESLLQRLKGPQGRICRLRTGEFGSFWWALGVGTVSSYLVPGPGMITQGALPPGCKS